MSIERRTGRQTEQTCRRTDRLQVNSQITQTLCFKKVHPAGRRPNIHDNNVK